MLVPAGKRSLSDLEFYKLAAKLRKEITQLLLRDFSIKDTVRNVANFGYTKHMIPEDRQTLERLMAKYEFGQNVIERYPDWLISHIRENILNLLKDMTHNITEANSIFPTTKDELYKRKQFQNGAIAATEKLMQELQFAAEVFPVDLNKYLPYIDDIAKEAKLLRGWKNSSSEKFKNLPK